MTERDDLWPARRRLGDALRDLLDELDRVGPTAEAIDEASGRVHEVTARLTAAPPADAGRRGGADAPPFAGMEHFLDRSPVVGLTNPMAPPFAFEVDAAAERVVARGRFRRLHEGAPGLVHGGLLALVFDELLGRVTTFSGAPGMTGSLTVRFRRPTPIEVPLVLEGWIDGVEGRRIRVAATAEAHGEGPPVRTAEAEGTFIQVDDRKFEELEAARSGRGGGGSG